MLEVCVDSLESAVNAIHGGADELEVCSSLTEGGLTPSAGLVLQIARIVKQFDHKTDGWTIHKSCRDCSCSKLMKKPKVNVMIRCRTGTDFNYSELEIETMLSEIELYKKIGVDRFVFGALRESRHIDEAACASIVQKAGSTPVTFHRAFDVCTEPTSQSISKIYKLGFSRLLTSGQKCSASDPDALECINSLLNSHGDKMEIMPGACIDCDNAKIFIDLGCKIVHSSCKRIRYLSPSKSGLSMGTNDSEHIYVTDESIVRRMKDIIISK